MNAIKLVLRFIWMIVFFTLVQCIVFLPVFLFGLFTFPAWWRWAPKEEFLSSMTGEHDTRFSWAWLDELLGNHEDGLLPAWWITEDAGTAYGWFVRNPVANMRFWPVVSTLLRRGPAYGAAACILPWRVWPCILSKGWPAHRVCAFARLY